MLIALIAGACTSSDATSTKFCERLAAVTGSNGVEALLQPGDPDRIDGVVDELAELHDRAPEEISATTRTLLNFFRTYQRSARSDRRQVIADNEAELTQASADLDSYALDECGLFLNRALPTPLPTVNQNLEVNAD